MTERLRIDVADIEALRRAMSEAAAGRSFSDQELQLLLRLIAHRRAEDEIVQAPTPRSGRAVLGARPLNGRYVVNVRKSLLVGALVALDALVTSGVALGTLTAAGYELRSLAALSSENGELCNFITLERHDPTQGALPCAEIARRTAGGPCRHPAFGCRHERQCRCTIDEAAVSANGKRMAKGGAVMRDESGALTIVSA